MSWKPKLVKKLPQSCHLSITPLKINILAMQKLEKSLLFWQKPNFSVAFSLYKSVSINIFVFFQNKLVEFHKYFLFFHWNPYLKTDSANLLVLFSVNDFHKRIFRKFSVIFLHNVFSKNVYIALGKTKNAENRKT